jgi:hypothetical protein
MAGWRRDVSRVCVCVVWCGSRIRFELRTLLERSLVVLTSVASGLEIRR